MFSLGAMDKRPIDRALELAEARDWTQARFAAEIGATDQDITNWKKRGLPSKRFAKVAEVLGCSIDTLVGRQPGELAGKASLGVRATGTLTDGAATNVEPMQLGRAVPLISWVQAGGLEDIEDVFHPGDADVWINAVKTAPSRRAFALRVVGDSMTSPYAQHSFPEGTIIIVDPERSPKAGDYVVAKDVDSQGATFKRLTTDGTQWVLQPLNPQWPAKPIDDPALRVIGVAIEFINSGKL